MQRIECQNIKCEGCVKKIHDALLEQYPSLRVDIATQSVEVEANADELESIKAQLQKLGFLPTHGVFHKIKGFFNK